jgi:hypothetical protein
MGLLDDAIREHLELKRKHGADPEDVARQEREALGPGQRTEFAQPAAETEAAAEPAAPPETEPEPAAAEGPPVADMPVPEFEPGRETPAPEDALPEGEPGVPEEPTAEHPAAAPGYDEDPWLEDDEPDEVPSEDALEQRPAPPSGEEDVLEETPEFLQETPEHDRLWFEQKPPKDFDWDK